MVKSSQNKSTTVHFLTKQSIKCAFLQPPMILKIINGRNKVEIRCRRFSEICLRSARIDQREIPAWGAGLPDVPLQIPRIKKTEGAMKGWSICCWFLRSAWGRDRIPSVLLLKGPKLAPEEQQSSERFFIVVWTTCQHLRKKIWCNISIWSNTEPDGANV